MSKSKPSTGKEIKAVQENCTPYAAKLRITPGTKSKPSKTKEIKAPRANCTSYTAKLLGSRICLGLPTRSTYRCVQEEKIPSAHASKTDITATPATNTVAAPKTVATAIPTTVITVTPTIDDDFSDASVEGQSNQKQFFIDGPRSTGKTFLYNTLIAYLKGIHNRNLIVVVSSGIAHSCFKASIPIFADSTCNLTNQLELGRKVRDADVIFWDEAPMQHRYIFETVDRIVLHLTNTPNTIFGGKTVLFGGDFRQVLPIAVRSSQSQIVDACLKHSELIWSHMEVLKLTQNMRVKENSTNDRAFIDFLLRVGDGTEPAVHSGDEEDYIRIPDDILFTPRGQPMEDSLERQFIWKVYPGIATTHLDPTILRDSAILTPLNADVDKLNSLATSMLPGSQPTLFYSQDSIPDSDSIAAA